MTTEIALNNDLLAQLSADADTFNPESSGGLSVPILKISTNKRCPQVMGKWVVGQVFEKDEKGGITGVSEPGKVVEKIVIIQARNRYNRFVQSDRSKNCSSPLFVMDVIRGGNNSIRGWKYRNLCGKNTCQYHKGYAGNESRNDACKCEWVVFAIAITTDGEEIPCVAYIGGSKFMPFSEYYTSSQVFRANNRQIKVPTFAYETILLEPELNSSGGVDYYVPAFKRGDVFGISDADRYNKMKVMAEATVKEIEASNESMMVQKEQKKTDGVDPNYTPMMAVESKSATEKMDDLPWDKPVEDNKPKKSVSDQMDEITKLIDGVPF